MDALYTVRMLRALYRLPQPLIPIEMLPDNQVNCVLSDNKRAPVVLVDLDTLYAVSDYVTLHVALTQETHGMLNDETFGKMKRGVRVVNCARGELVDGEALPFDSRPAGAPAPTGRGPAGSPPPRATKSLTT